MSNITAVPLRGLVTGQFERIAGRHDDPTIYGGPVGDPGLIGPGSVSWRLHGDLASVALAGTAAILLELLHPSVIAGVQDRSSFQRDPYRRSRRTLAYVLTTTFGNTDAATGLIEQVKQIHRHINGTRPDGVPYSALDPELIAWVHTCIPWMILRTYEQLRGPLPPGDADRYLAEQAPIGLMGGADWVPTTTAELDDYVAEMRPKLAVTSQTREFIDFILASPLAPQLPGTEYAYARFLAHAYMTLAPQWTRELTGFDRFHPLATPILRPYLRVEAGLVRWALGTPPHVVLSRARMGLPPLQEPSPLLPTAALRLAGLPLRTLRLGQTPREVQNAG